MESDHLFPPGLVAGAEIAKKFGQKIAEKPIQDDMRQDSGLGRPGGDLWVDTAAGLDPDDNMIQWMGLRGDLPWAQVSRMLDWRHRRKEFATPPPEAWARPDAVCHTRAAKEYYEIKPMSPSGIPAADKKFELIDQFIAGPVPPDTRSPWTKRLPYVRGTKYMTELEVREKEIEIPDALKTLLTSLMSMFNLTDIRLFVVWERPMPAMILYVIKIRVKTKDSRPASKGAMRDLAKYVLALAIQIEVPEANLVKPPKGVISVEVPPELNHFKAAIKASAGGMVFDAVPGETHLLVIEERGFQRIIERQRQLPLFLRSTGPMFNHEEWQRAIRQFDAALASQRDKLIVMGALVLMAGVAIYVCWPVIAAAGAAEAVVGTGAAAGATDAAVVSTGSGALGRSGATVLVNFLRGAAANDNAVAVAKAAGFALIPTGFVFGNVKDAAAAERVLKTSVMMVSDTAFDPTWLLRPNNFSGPGPEQFGELVEVALFGLLRIPGLNIPIDQQKPATKMRLIARVTFS